MTNHDVKAIEYIMKRRLQGNAELAEVRPCLNPTDLASTCQAVIAAYFCLP